MKTRRVFSTPDLITARAAMQAAREAGIHDEDISLVARPDIEVGHIPNRRKEADSDFVPAAMRGAMKFAFHHETSRSRGDAYANHLDGFRRLRRFRSTEI